MVTGEVMSPGPCPLVRISSYEARLGWRKDQGRRRNLDHHLYLFVAERKPEDNQRPGYKDRFW